MCATLTTRAATIAAPDASCDGREAGVVAVPLQRLSCWLLGLTWLATSGCTTVAVPMPPPVSPSALATTGYVAFVNLQPNVDRLTKLWHLEFSAKLMEAGMDRYGMTMPWGGCSAFPATSPNSTVWTWVLAGALMVDKIYNSDRESVVSPRPGEVVLYTIEVYDPAAPYVSLNRDSVTLVGEGAQNLIDRLAARTTIATCPTKDELAKWSLMRAPVSVSPATSPAASRKSGQDSLTSSILSDLDALRQLHDHGLLTDEEYQKRRAEVLKKLP